jgi:hypothetical protein
MACRYPCLKDLERLNLNGLGPTVLQCFIISTLPPKINLKVMHCVFNLKLVVKSLVIVNLKGPRKGISAPYINLILIAHCE